MPWSQLGYENAPEGGFSVCVPEPWSIVPGGPTNQVVLTRGGDPPTTLSLSGEMGLDHMGAVDRLADIDAGACTFYAGYEVELLALTGWPALRQGYTEEPAPCGECPPGPAPQLHVVNASVAADVFVVHLRGQTGSPPDAATVDELLAITDTLAVTGVAEPDASATMDELGALATAHDAACP